jgi:hypothetical protein
MRQAVAERQDFLVVGFSDRLTIAPGGGENGSRERNATRWIKGWRLGVY